MREAKRCPASLVQGKTANVFGLTMPGQPAEVPQAHPTAGSVIEGQGQVMAVNSDKPDPRGTAQAVDVSAALIEEFRRVQPDWLPPGDAAPGIEATLQHLHNLPEAQRPTALCLSGGGIRSATFSLGVLQALARNGLLQRFDYLSSVSGGGYIASWLVGWLRREEGRWDKVLPLLADGLQPAQRPASQHPRAASDPSADPIRRLRAYSNYLSPVWGLSSDALSLVAIFLRNLLLNLMVWLPLLMALTLLPRAFVAAAGTKFSDPFIWTVGVLALGLVQLAIAYTVADLPDPQSTVTLPRSQFKLWCFWPLLLGAMGISLVAAWYGKQPGQGQLPAFVLAGVALHVAGIVAGVQWRKRRRLALRETASHFKGALMVLLIGAIGGALVWLALQNPMQADRSGGPTPLMWATFSVPAMLGCYWLVLSLYAGLARRWSGEDEREWWSRASGAWLMASLAWLLLFGLVLHLPLWLLNTFGGQLPLGVELSLGGTLLGVATALAGYWSKNGASLKRRAQGLLRVTGMRMLDAMAALVVVILLLVLSLAGGWLAERCHGSLPGRLAAHLCAQDLHAGAQAQRAKARLTGPAASVAAAPATAASAPAPQAAEAQAFAHVLEQGDVRGLLAAVGLLSVLALGVSMATGANAFSLHGMYGNRLVRAYLGATRARRRPHWFTGFDPEDNLLLDDRPEPQPAPPGPHPAEAPPPAPVTIRPFHVINLALNLVAPSNRRLAWQQRKAASFTATPLRCGADGLGYVPAWAYGGRQGMTLGRAMTISGAAASPNMGYHSSPLVTLVMSLFNVRLGWWLPNPSPDGQRSPDEALAQWRRDEPTMPLRILLEEAAGRTTDTRSSVYLSDGGHFENLGLYEMVRRRCHRIVVVDATCDPTFAYADLHDSVRKIRVDLGIPVELPDVLPGPDRSTEHPRRVIGRIRYSARDGNAPADDGWLYLIKPRLVGGEPPELAHYAQGDGGGSSPFPHQSTADQFFEEAQFESYRLLGMLSAEQCFPGGTAGQTLPDWPEPDPWWRSPAVGTPAPAAKQAKADKPAEAAASSGLGSSLLEGVQQMGTSTALATALTVGGTLGVAGTVALAPSEIQLSQADRELLKAGLTLKLANGALTLNDADRDLLKQGLKVDVSGTDAGEALNDLAESAEQALDALATAGERLSDAAERLQAGGGTAASGPAGSPGQPGAPGAPGTAGAADPAVATALNALAAALRQLEQRLKAPLVVQGDPGLPALVSRIEQLTLQLQRPTDLAALRDEIGRVNGALVNLKASVDAANPRRNVRGQEGGSP